MTDKLVFQKENMKIEIAQVDWRDDFNACFWIQQ